MPVDSQFIRFGLYELDLHSNELRKSGRRIKLQEQPFRLLKLLIENPGQPVSRDKLKEALWATDTFVDFDHSLNAAIAKLRLALGDPADNPRFVETVARRGYRFIAPVELVRSSVEVLPPRSIEISAHPEPGLNEIPPPAPPSTSVSKVIWMGVAGCTLLAFTVAAFWLQQKRHPPETELVRLTSGAGLNTNPAVSPDGKLLAYASDRDSAGNLNIWLQQLRSQTGAVQLTHDGVDTDQPTFSPDGATIAFHSNKDGGGIYTIPVIGGQPTLLAPFGRNPRFSPNGLWVAYSSAAFNSGGVLSGNGSGGVFIVQAAGGTPRRIARDIEGPANPLWSPDSGHLLVYVSPKMGIDWSSADWWLTSIDGQPSERTGNFQELKRRGFSLGFDQVPSAAQWNNNGITFAAGFGDSVNIWRAAVSSTGRISGAVTRLTSGTTLEVEPALDLHDDLIFASLNQKSAIWSLTANTDTGKLAGRIEKITNGPAEMMPSISADGERLAYTAGRSRANYGVSRPASVETVSLRSRFRDLSTGLESAGVDSEMPEWHPQISRDGSVVSYTAGKPGRLFATTFDGKATRLLLGGQNCFSWAWSLDNKRLLFSTGTNARDQQIFSLDIERGQKTLLLQKPGYSFFQAKFSPNDQAIAVLGCHEDDRAVMQCHIFIVPMENNKAASPEHWISINHSSQWDDKPRWSPNGSMLYFVSDRDGYLCLWAQRLDPQTKQPMAEPFAVYHLHNSRLSMSNLDTGFLEIDVARQKIVLGAGELTGDIWFARKDNSPQLWTYLIP